MWIFPKPLYQKFAQLGEVHKEFTENLSEFRYHLLCVVELHKVLSEEGFTMLHMYYIFIVFCVGVLRERIKRFNSSITTYTILCQVSSYRTVVG